jgi:hypothetical protein
VVTEAQIVGVLLEHEQAAQVADLWRPQVITETTFCRSKRKYNGLQASESDCAAARRNRHLRGLVTHLAL